MSDKTPIPHGWTAEQWELARRAARGELTYEQPGEILTDLDGLPLAVAETTRHKTGFIHRTD